MSCKSPRATLSLGRLALTKAQVALLGATLMLAATSCNRGDESQASPTKASTQHATSRHDLVPMFDAKKVSPPPTNPRAIQIAVGGASSCAVLSDGSVWCWGSDRQGELGWDQPLTNNVPSRPVPTRVHGVTGATQVAISSGQGCAILKDRKVTCWGSGSGNPRTGLATQRLLAKTVAGLSDVDQLTLAGPLGCALHTDGGVSCWLGAGGRMKAATRASTLTKVAEIRIDAQRRRVCVRLQDGTVRCGSSKSKQLAAGKVFADLTQVHLDDKARSIAVSYQRECAALESGSLMCWQVATGPKRPDAGPSEAKKVAGLDRVAEVALQGGSICVRRTDDTLTCQGSSARSGTKRQSVELKQIKAFGASWHACALNQEGKISCWGGNGDGQLGDGSRSTRLQPVALRW